MRPGWTTPCGATALTIGEPEMLFGTGREPGRRVAATDVVGVGSSAGASRSGAPPGVRVADVADLDVSPVRAGSVVVPSCGLASTVSSGCEPGRWMKPMRTAPMPIAVSASTTTPTMRSVPAPFWPPPVASDLAAILVPLLVVTRGGAAGLRRVGGGRGHVARLDHIPGRRRVQAVGRRRELGHRGARAVVLVVRRELRLRDGDDP